VEFLIGARGEAIMIIHTLIQASELILLIAVIAAFITAARTLFSDRTFLATVSWNG